MKSFKMRFRFFFIVWFFFLKVGNSFDLSSTTSSETPATEERQMVKESLWNKVVKTVANFLPIFKKGEEQPESNIPPVEEEPYLTDSIATDAVFKSNLYREKVSRLNELINEGLVDDEGTLEIDDGTSDQSIYVDNEEGDKLPHFIDIIGDTPSYDILPEDDENTDSFSYVEHPSGFVHSSREDFVDYDYEYDETVSDILREEMRFKEKYPEIYTIENHERHSEYDEPAPDSFVDNSMENNIHSNTNLLNNHQPYENYIPESSNNDYLLHEYDTIEEVGIQPHNIKFGNEAEKSDFSLDGGEAEIDVTSEHDNPETKTELQTLPMEATISSTNNILKTESLRKKLMQETINLAENDEPDIFSQKDMYELEVPSEENDQKFKMDESKMQDAKLFPRKENPKIKIVTENNLKNIEMQFQNSPPETNIHPLKDQQETKVFSEKDIHEIKSSNYDSKEINIPSINIQDDQSSSEKDTNINKYLNKYTKRETKVPFENLTPQFSSENMKSFPSDTKELKPSLNGTSQVNEDFSEYDIPETKVSDGEIVYEFIIFSNDESALSQTSLNSDSSTTKVSRNGDLNSTEFPSETNSERSKISLNSGFHRKKVASDTSSQKYKFSEQAGTHENDTVLSFVVMEKTNTGSSKTKVSQDNSDQSEVSSNYSSLRTNIWPDTDFHKTKVTPDTASLNKRVSEQTGPHESTAPYNMNSTTISPIEKKSSLVSLEKNKLAQETNLNGTKALLNTGSHETNPLIYSNVSSSTGSHKTLIPPESTLHRTEVTPDTGSLGNKVSEQDKVSHETNLNGTKALLNTGSHETNPLIHSKVSSNKTLIPPESNAPDTGSQRNRISEQTGTQGTADSPTVTMLPRDIVSSFVSSKIDKVSQDTSLKGKRISPYSGSHINQVPFDNSNYSNVPSNSGSSRTEVPQETGLHRNNASPNLDLAVTEAPPKSNRQVIKFASKYAMIQHFNEAIDELLLQYNINFNEGAFLLQGKASARDDAIALLGYEIARRSGDINNQKVGKHYEIEFPIEFGPVAVLPKSNLRQDPRMAYTQTGTGVVKVEKGEGEGQKFSMVGVYLENLIPRRVAFDPLFNAETKYHLMQQIGRFARRHQLESFISSLFDRSLSQMKMI